MTHAVHGHARRWLLNEKGAVAATDALLGPSVGFGDAVGRVFGGLTSDPDDLGRAIARAGSLLAAVRSATAG